MTIAEDLWLRGQAAQRNYLEITAYSSAFLQTATLQALHLTWNAPATFWSAMARVGEAPAANAPLKSAVTQGADIVQLVAPVPAPEPAPKAAPKPKAAAPSPAAAPAKAPVAVAPVADAPPKAPADPTPAAPVAKTPKAKTAGAAPPKAAEAPKVAKAPKAPAVPEPNPLLLDEPRGGKPDDLTVLSGIGAKLQTALNEFGIYHFDQLAGLNADGIAWLNAQQKGFAMTCERYDIVAQAKARLA
jgi:predicted flap endonuclease-1-like 5' DNA nuclease